MSNKPVSDLAVWLDETDRMLSLLNTGFPPVHQMSAVAAREAIASRVRPIDNADDVESAEDMWINGNLRVRVYRPRNPAGKFLPAIVYLHGGGFVFCSIESHDGFCRRMSRHTESVVISVDYRLAPEHPAPAAAEDAFAAFSWTVDSARILGIDADRIAVGGDSAGGNLAAMICVMARKAGGPMPRAQILLYPMVEPQFETSSYRRFGTGYYNTEASLRWYWEQYLGPQPTAEVLSKSVPTACDNLSEVAPAIVYVAGRDPLASEGEAYARRLQDAGVHVRYRFFPEQFHGFCTFAAFGPAHSAQQILWADINKLMAGDIS